MSIILKPWDFTFHFRSTSTVKKDSDFGRITQAYICFDTVYTNFPLSSVPTISYFILPHLKSAPFVILYVIAFHFLSSLGTIFTSSALN